MRKEKCKHIFKPIKFAKCDMTPEGRRIYIYQMQCMCCGKKYRFGFFPIYMGFKETQSLYASYELSKLLSGYDYTYVDDASKRKVFQLVCEELRKNHAHVMALYDGTLEKGDIYPTQNEVSAMIQDIVNRGK